MKKKLLRLSFFIIVFIFVLIILQKISFADEKLPTSDYYTGLKYGDATYIFNKGGKALKILRNIAAIVSIATITIIGIRYMTGSVEQKAEYKQTMMPVVIACIFIASLSTILTVIQSIFK